MPRAKKNKQAGAAFKELLEQKGFSNYKLAKAIGMGTGHIGRIASGEIASPTPATLEKIAAALGVELGELTMIFAQSPVRAHSAEVPPPQEEAQEETVSKNPDFVEREEAITYPYPENDLDELVRRVRSKRKHRIQDQCGKMKLLNISQRVDTDDLYVDVNVLRDIPSQRYTDISQLARGFDPTDNDFDRFYLGKVPYKRVRGIEVIEDRCKVMVLGKPGSGKTTFLQYLAIECEIGKLQTNRVPIFIRLSRFVENAIDEGSLILLDYINQEFRNSGIDYPKASETLLKHGKCLILLDGLDEVPGTYSLEVVKQIRYFCDSYSNNSLVITCRTNAHNYSFYSLGFIEVEIADFKGTQINKFAEKWFTAVDRNNNKVGKATANDFLKKLNLSENKRIRDLAVTPILLHLTCLFFRDRNGNFPISRAELYQEGIDILLSKWDKSKGIQRDEVYGNLSSDDKKDLLSYVAATLFQQNNYFPRQDKLQPMIAAYLKLPITQGKVVLQSIENQHGLLVERAQGIYSFSHLTFQEYLTAKEIISKSDNISALKIWLENITEKRWREVFLLLADLLYLLPSADNLLLLMKEKIDGIIAKNVKLQEFITWVHQKSLAVSSSYRPVAVRAFYCTLDYEANLRFDRNFIHSLDTDFARICIQILDLARALNLNPNQACSLSKDCGLALDIALNISLTIAFNLCTGNIQRNRILGITRALNFALLLNSKLHNEIQELKEQIPLMKEDLESFYDWWKFHGQTWTKKLRNLMIKHLNIPHNWFSTNIDNFSFSFWGDESASLNQYYDANKLLVDCLNRAANVTPTVRSHIEDTLLLPIAEIEKRKLAD